MTTSHTVSLPIFRITGGKGFHVTFENGWTVSVQFGPGNYCDHYNRSIMHEAEKCGAEGSSTAEVAAWAVPGTMHQFDDGDTVQGRQTPAQVLTLMNWAASQPAHVSDEDVAGDKP